MPSLPHYSLNFCFNFPNQPTPLSLAYHPSIALAQKHSSLWPPFRDPSCLLAYIFVTIFCHLTPPPIHAPFNIPCSLQESTACMLHPLVLPFFPFVLRVNPTQTTITGIDLHIFIKRKKSESLTDLVQDMVHCMSIPSEPPTVKDWPNVKCVQSPSFATA